MKEHYSSIVSKVGAYETYYKHTQMESISIEIVYLESEKINIWSVDIKKMINRFPKQGLFTISNVDGNITKEEYQNKLNQCLKFLNKQYEIK